MSDTAFSDQLARKKKQLEQPTADVKRRIGRWRLALGELGIKLQKWLDDPVRKQIVTIEKVKKDISEELAGTYEVHGWLVKLGTKTVHFDPVATYVVGSYGRVDVKGPAGTFRLIREKDDGHWSVVDAANPTTTYPLTKALFQDMLLTALG